MLVVRVAVLFHCQYVSALCRLDNIGKYTSGVGILFPMWSLIQSMHKITISVDSLNLYLSDLKKLEVWNKVGLANK